MKKLTIVIGLILVMLLVFFSCAPPPPAPAPAPVPRPASDARVAELEAKIRQLDVDNHRLLAENQQFNSELLEITAVLQNLRNLVTAPVPAPAPAPAPRPALTYSEVVLQNLRNLFTSSDYTQTLSKLPKIQNDAGELAAFLSGLPDLPPPPPGLTVAQIDDAINKARHLRDILEQLPDLPPPGWPGWLPFPQELIELDNARQTFIDMTEWMEDLEDLPEFLRISGDLNDLRSDMTAYLRDIDAILSDVKAILEEVRNTASP